MPEYYIIKPKLRTKRDTTSEDTKQIHMDAFGQKMQLNLRKNTDFEDRIKSMKVLMAETTGPGQLKYHEPQVSTHYVNWIIIILNELSY